MRLRLILPRVVAAVEAHRYEYLRCGRTRRVYPICAPGK
jgi:hypothetical protein